MAGVIAIDGPAGAGKSTLSRLLARELGYRHLDTGAMYRAITWLAIERGIDLNNEEALTELARETEIKFLPADSNGVCPIIVNGQDLTNEIRKPLVNKYVSLVARIEGVREVMVKLQRKMAEEGEIIIDGRDIGSRVVPNADLKLFITASLEERARRRFNELKEKNLDLKFKEVREEIARRDKIDSEREVSPLVRVEDALLIDTTDLSIEEVVKKIKTIIDKGESNG
ncbi:MAG: CMP/dCMP kinase [Halanaerobiales bacterium]|nr:CMP/dCMP kinase [Halanaerobiales bacterium]